MSEIAPEPRGPSRSLKPRKIGLVLAGGAARGAYEAGVIQYIDEAFARELGRPVPLDIVCGTSVGAINACGLAAHADEPGRRGARLVEQWEKLRIGDLLRVEGKELIRLLRGIAGRVRPDPSVFAGGLVDASPLAELLTKFIPFPHIDSNIRSGHLSAVSVSATHLATGTTVVFVQQARGAKLPWNPRDPHIRARAVRLRASHALASAALPVVFPAVRVEGAYFCDGGVHQNVPLSPARRLGADGLIVVNPRYVGRDAALPELGTFRETTGVGPLSLLGKTLSALVLDRVDNDIDRLERINAILDAGEARFGERFVDELNEELSSRGEKPLRPLRVVHIRPSENLAALGADYIRSSAFTNVSGVLGRILKQLAAQESHEEADLATLLLFEGGFAKQLIELGRADAKASHEALGQLFEARLRGMG